MSSTPNTPSAGNTAPENAQQQRTPEQRAAADVQAQREATNAAVNQAANIASHTPETASTAETGHGQNAPHGGAHDTETHGSDTIQNLINAAKEFKKPADELTWKEVGTASLVGGGAVAASAIPALGQYLTSANGLGKVINGTMAFLHNIVHSIPFIGPTLTDAAIAAQTGITSTIGSLGFYGTAGAALGTLGGLWTFGKLKSIVTREQYTGVRRPIYEALKTPLQLGIGAVKVPYQALVHGPGYVADKAYGALKTTWKYTGAPAYKWAKENVWNHSALKPTLWGAGLGLAGAGIVAPFTGGSSLLVGAGMYALGNYLKNNNYFKAADAAPAHH